MARLVTSDGVQVNLFLDLDSNNTGEGTLLYGPKSQPNMDFIVQGFKDFRTNTEFNNKNRLVFHCDHQITVYISSIMGGNYPTVSNPYVVDSETQLYYVGNDLVLSKTGTKIHRIDLFKSASTNIDDLEDSMFDGNYNSLTNKPTIPSDINDLSDVGGLLSSGGGGFTTQKVFTTSATWTVPAGVTQVKVSVTGHGTQTSRWISGNFGGQYSITGGGSGGTAIGVFNVSSGVVLQLTVGNPGGGIIAPATSSVSFDDRTGTISATGAQSYINGNASNTITSGIVGDVFLISGGRCSGDTQEGAASIYGTGPAYGGGFSDGGTAGVAVIVLEY